MKRREYRRKISGPIADRIDITRFVEPVREHERARRSCRSSDPRPSAPIRVRVTAARERQRVALRRDAVAAQRARPGSDAARAWPLTDEAMVAARRGGLRRPTDPSRCRAGAPGGLVGGRPGRRRAAGLEELDVALRLRAADAAAAEQLPGAALRPVREGA